LTEKFTRFVTFLEDKKAPKWPKMGQKRRFLRFFEKAWGAKWSQLPGAVSGLFFGGISVEKRVLGGG
jgi:hypothetical protein